MCVFIDRTVLDHRSWTFTDLSNLVKTMIEKIDLEVKRPLGHVAIEVAQVRVLIYRFEKGSPAVMLRKLLSKSTFTRANVAGNRNVFDLLHSGVRSQETDSGGP